MTLQNHPGEREFPVRPRYRYAVIAGERRRAGQPGRRRRALRLAAGSVALGALTAAVVMSAASALPAGLDEVTRLVGWVGPFLFGAAFGFLGLAIADAVHEARRPRREQRRYRALTGTPALTPRQQQLLALAAADDAANAGWNSSLETGPTWAALPEALRARYDDGRDGSPFLALPVQDPRALRRHLDDHYRIASGRDLELRAADVWAGRGAAVALLARLTQQAGADAVAARLAALAGTTEWAVRELLEPRAGRPPQLLWAGDVRQVVGLARLGYAAGYLDAERAWALIERAGSVAFALFDTYDEFHANARLWTAWVEDGLDDVQRYDDRVAALRRSGWPAASVDFPADRDVVLPSAVTDPWSVAGDVHSAEG